MYATVARYDTLNLTIKRSIVYSARPTIFSARSISNGVTRTTPSYTDRLKSTAVNLEPIEKIRRTRKEQKYERILEALVNETTAAIAISTQKNLESTYGHDANGSQAAAVIRRYDFVKLDFKRHIIPPLTGAGVYFAALAIQR